MFDGMNYINGKFHKLTPSFSSYNPSTEEELGRFPSSTAHVVTFAVDAAFTAFNKWRLESRVKRGEYFDNLAQILKGRKEIIAQAISLETGKSLIESQAEILESLHMIQYTAGKGREPYGKMIASEIAEKDSYSFRKPKGVIAVITSWNFAFALCWWNSAPAILEGNTVVFKPSEETSMVGQLIAQLYDDAGFPPGVFNLVHGGKDVGEFLVKEDVNHISFTGSAAVGKKIKIICAASDTNKSCSLEMGSKSAIIVCDDANIDLAVNCSFMSAYKLSGQRCVSASRLLVQRSVFNEFKDKFVEMASKIKIGDPIAEPNSMMGPLINETQMNRVIEYNERTKSSTEILLQGKRLDRKGWFLTPHVYMAEWRQTAWKSFMQEEVFGPHCAIIPFDDLDEAIYIYNDTDFGLSLSVCTTDYTKMRKIRNECDFGMGYVNLPGIGSESHNAFIGVKGSGSGGGSAAASFTTFTDEVAWTVNHDETGFQMAQGLK